MSEFPNSSDVLLLDTNDDFLSTIIDLSSSKYTDNLSDVKVVFYF